MEVTSILLQIDTVRFFFIYFKLFGFVDEDLETHKITQFVTYALVSSTFMYARLPNKAYRNLGSRSLRSNCILLLQTSAFYRFNF